MRRHLDQAGLAETRIFASGDLDEFIIADLLARGAQIDTFGVGTALATSEDAPALGGVYKLVDVASGETLSGLAKFSEEKIPRPNCCSAASCVKASASRPHRTSSRSATAPVELSRLPEPCRHLQNPAPYPVHFSCELEALLEDLRHGLTQPAGKKGA